MFESNNKLLSLIFWKHFKIKNKFPFVFSHKYQRHHILWINFEKVIYNLLVLRAKFIFTYVVFRTVKKRSPMFLRLIKCDWNYTLCNFKACLGVRFYSASSTWRKLSFCTCLPLFVGHLLYQNINSGCGTIWLNSELFYVDRQLVVVIEVAHSASWPVRSDIVLKCAEFARRCGSVEVSEEATANHTFVWADHLGRLVVFEHPRATRWRLHRGRQEAGWRVWRWTRRCTGSASLVTWPWADCGRRVSSHFIAVKQAGIYLSLGKQWYWGKLPPTFKTVLFRFMTVQI